MTDITDRLDRIEASLKRRELIYDAREQVGWLEIEQLNSLFAYLKTLMSDAAPPTELDRIKDLHENGVRVDVTNMSKDEMRKFFDAAPQQPDMVMVRRDDLKVCMHLAGRDWVDMGYDSEYNRLRQAVAGAAPSPKEKLAEPTYTSIDFLVYDAYAYRGFPLIVRVNHRMIDGMHFFTSDDDRANGLLVSSADLREAFDDVSLQLERLLAFNFKQSRVSKFVPLMSFEEFESRLAKGKE